MIKYTPPHEQVSLPNKKNKNNKKIFESFNFEIVHCESLEFEKEEESVLVWCFVLSSTVQVANRILTEEHRRNGVLDGSRPTLQQLQSVGNLVHAFRRSVSNRRACMFRARRPLEGHERCQVWPDEFGYTSRLRQTNGQNNI